MHAKRLFPLLLAIAPAAAFADVCGEVVGDTVAELRAGADGWWSEDAEALVRAAAGAACVKATSSRYKGAAAAVTSQAQDEAMTASTGPAKSEAIAASPGTAAAAATAVEEAGTNAATDAETDNGEFSFGGLTFRSMSGSPSKKPYERTRSKDES